MDKSEPEERSNKEENVSRKKHKKSDKEQDSSDDSDIERQCSLEKHLKFHKSYLPGHQFIYIFLTKDLIENKKNALKKVEHSVQSEKNIIN